MSQIAKIIRGPHLLPKSVPEPYRRRYQYFRTLEELEQHRAERKAASRTERSGITLQALDAFDYATGQPKEWNLNNSAIQLTDAAVIADAYGLSAAEAEDLKRQLNELEQKHKKRSLWDRIKNWFVH